MNIDAGREKVDEGKRPRRTLNRLTPAEKPGQAEEQLTQSPSQEAVDQNKPIERNILRGAEEKAKEAVRSKPPLSAWLRRMGYYGLALLLVAIGVMVRMALTRLVGPGLAPYITFYPLVMLAALIGGWGPGLLATLATVVVVDYWLLPPQGLFEFESTADAMGLALFSAMGIFTSVVAELHRRTRDHLEELVIVRTAALRQANDQLKQEGCRAPVCGRGAAGERGALPPAV